MKKVVIIGGGIAGLSAAYHLQEKAKETGEKVEYLLVEKDERLGGKIRTEKVDGYVIEGGPDCFLWEKPSVYELSSRLGLQDRFLGTNEESKGTWVLADGRLHPLPEGLMLMIPTRIMPFVTSTLISWPGKFRMAMDLFIPRRKGDGDESLASFVTRRLGQEALDKIAEPLVAGIHAGDPNTMSLQASFPRFLQMEAKYGSLLKAMLAARSQKGKSAAKPNNQGSVGKLKIKPTYFMGFIDGLEELPATVAQRLQPGCIIMGKAVTALKKGTEKAYSVHVEGMGPVEADAVILAIPAFEAAALMEGVDPELASMLNGISFVSSATVNLAYRKSDVPQSYGFGVLVPRVEGRKIMAVTFSSVKWSHRVPDQEQVLLRVFVGGPGNHDLVTQGDEELLAMVKKDLREILGITAEPELARIFRWIKGMPQYTLGHLDRMAKVDTYMERHPGLYLAGGSYRGIGIPDCINSGIGAANKVWERLAAREAGAQA